MSRNLFEDFTTGEELEQLHDYLQAENRPGVQALIQRLPEPAQPLRP